MPVDNEQLKKLAGIPNNIVNKMFADATTFTSKYKSKLPYFGKKMFWLVSITESAEPYVSVSYDNSISIQKIILGSAHDLLKTYHVELFESEAEAKRFTKQLLEAGYVPES